MAIDDEFYLDDEDLNADFALTPIDTEKLKVIDAVKVSLDKVADNIRFKEKEEEEKNLQILSNYVNAMLQLVGYEKANMSGPELMEKIKAIDEAVREVSLIDVELDIPVDDENANGIDLIDGDNFDF